jgi:hypothetical protein
MLAFDFDTPRGQNMKTNPLSMLVAAVLVVAFLSTFVARGGWLMWFPVLLALAVVGFLAKVVRR